MSAPIYSEATAGPVSVLERMETWLLSRLNQLTGSGQPIAQPFIVESFISPEDVGVVLQDTRMPCPGGALSVPTIDASDDGNQLTRLLLTYRVLIALPMDRADFDRQRRYLMRIFDRLNAIQHQRPTRAEFPGTLGTVDFVRVASFQTILSADRHAGLYTFQLRVSRYTIPYQEGL